MEIQVDELLAIVGQKEVELYSLRKEMALMQQTISALESKVKTLSKQLHGVPEKTEVLDENFIMSGRA